MHSCLASIARLLEIDELKMKLFHQKMKQFDLLLATY